jgi:hypothetical protein
MGKRGMINPNPMTAMVPARAIRINSFPKVRIIGKYLEFSD